MEPRCVRISFLWDALREITNAEPFFIKNVLFTNVALQFVISEVYDELVTSEWASCTFETLRNPLADYLSYIQGSYYPAIEHS